MTFIFIIFGFLVLACLLVFTAQVLNSNKLEQEEVLPYRLKDNFFSQSEFKFYKTLFEELDTQRFGIFSKVRVADFVETTAKGKEFQRSFNHIKSKHIDFLIWDNKKNIIAVGIELDGNSHGSVKMQKRDDFINKLYTQIQFPVKRIAVGKVFADEVKSIKTQIEID